jgi:Cu/Zn superoxide dismutase
LLVDLLLANTDPVLTFVVATVRGDSKVSGTVTFEQESESSPTTITWDITGNDPNAERGIHVHQFGDNTNGCTSAGPHCELLSNART